MAQLGLLDSSDLTLLRPQSIVVRAHPPCVEGVTKPSQKGGFCHLENGHFVFFRELFSLVVSGDWKRCP